MFFALALSLARWLATAGRGTTLRRHICRGHIARLTDTIAVSSSDILLSGRKSATFSAASTGTLPALRLGTLATAHRRLALIHMFALAFARASLGCRGTG